jgi:hypothetical protein
LVGDLPQGAVAKAEILSHDSLTVGPETLYALIGRKYKILGYTFAYAPLHGQNYIEQIKGAAFTAGVKNHLAMLKLNDWIFFSHISASDAKGNAVVFNMLSYEINDTSATAPLGSPILNATDYIYAPLIFGNDLPDHSVTKQYLLEHDTMHFFRYTNLKVSGYQVFYYPKSGKSRRSIFIKGDRLTDGVKYLIKNGRTGDIFIFYNITIKDNPQCVLPPCGPVYVIKE